MWGLSRGTNCHTDSILQSYNAANNYDDEYFLEFTEKKQHAPFIRSAYKCKWTEYAVGKWCIL